MLENVWHDVVGTVGVVLVLAAYLLLQLERLRSDSVWFSFVNALGSGMILVSLTQAFNFSAFVIEVCWIVISVYGMAKYGLRKPQPVE